MVPSKFHNCRYLRLQVPNCRLAACGYSFVASNVKGGQSTALRRQLPSCILVHYGAELVVYHSIAGVKELVNYRTQVL